MDLSILRRTAAEIVAAAVYETYPHVELLGGGEDGVGFFYEFYFPHPIHVPIIEEKIRFLIRERRPIQTLEMIPFSAAELLKAKGHQIRAEELEEQTELVQIIQIGSFCDLSPGPHLKNTAELAAFKISVAPLSEKKIRISGWCHQSKKELKDFLKILSRYTEPLQKGEQIGFWKGDVWLTQGLRKKEALIAFLKKKWFVKAFEISGPLEANRFDLHRSLGKPQVAEIWIQPPHKTCLQISFFASFEEEFISYLHLIGKTLTILGFDHSHVCKEFETEFRVVDELGRVHPLVRVKKTSKKGSQAIDFVVSAVVEEILLQMLEKNLVMVELENK